MTCIVGYKTPDGPILIGADSMSASVHSNSPGCAVHEAKVFKRDGFVFGGACSWRYIQLIRYVWQVPKHTDQGVEAFLFREAIPSLQACLKEHGAMKITDTAVQEAMDNAYGLFAYGGQLWEIQRDFSLLRSHHAYAAIGSGVQLALGALAAIERMPTEARFDTEPEGWMPDYEARVRIALEAAALHMPGSVRGPFIIETSA